jgi:hypothetical protein
VTTDHDAVSASAGEAASPRIVAPAYKGVRRLPGAFFVGMVVLAAGLFLTGSSLPSSYFHVLGRNAGVNRGAGDAADITAHNSPALARNPVDRSNVVVANRVDEPRYGCALHVSFDGGARWAATDLPFPDGEEAPHRCYAPDPAFDVQGTLYVAFITLIGVGNSPNALWITNSTDGGRTFSAPARVSGPLAFQMDLAADERFPGRLYLTWLQARELAFLGFAAPGNPIQMSWSDDGGRTWSAPSPVTPPMRQRVLAPSTSVDADGVVRVLYLDLGDDRLDYSGAHRGKGGDPYSGRWQLVLARSDDRGATWKETVVERRVVPAERFVAFLPPKPSLAVDPGGRRVYVAFADARLGDADVWLWRSADGGKTFSSGRRVNNTARRDRSAQYLPAVALAPDGRVDVVYFDRRADGGRNVMNEVSLQSSFNHGHSFEPRLRLSDGSFDSRIGFGRERGLADLGSRLALVSTDVRVMAVWPDTRAGTELSGKQDLARGIVAVSRGSRLRAPLRLFGAVAGVAAALMELSYFLVVRRKDVGRQVEGQATVLP